MQAPGVGQGQENLVAEENYVNGVLMVPVAWIFSALRFPKWENLAQRAEVMSLLAKMYSHIHVFWSLFRFLTLPPPFPPPCPKFLVI